MDLGSGRKSLDRLSQDVLGHFGALLYILGTPMTSLGHLTRGTNGYERTVRGSPGYH